MELDQQQLLSLYITYLDKEGPFLKVWGQLERNNAKYVEQFLQSTTRQFDQGLGTVSIEALQTGVLVAAKYKDSKYYRARILSVDPLNDLFVDVYFIDFGNKDVLPVANLRSLQKFPASFISIPPLATPFVLAEAHCTNGGEWDDNIFNTIFKELCHKEVHCRFMTQASQYYLIKLFVGNSDLSNVFVTRGLMQRLSVHAQQAVLLNLSMQKRQIQQQQINAAVPNNTVIPTEINTYKSCHLEPGSTYQVYVSYVNDGPALFTVQLQQNEEVLVKLMKEINSLPLKPLEDIPLPGTICLSRCEEDGNICRAVVTNEMDNKFTVFYVDFGNHEVVSLECLYQIPFKFVIPKVMAIKCGIVGIEKSSITKEMKRAFKTFVDNIVLYMKVIPSPTKSSVLKCELWDPKTKVTALDVVMKAALTDYPESLLFNRGFTQPVKVSFVYSCNRFYVQLVSKEPELNKLMTDLQLSCQADELAEELELKALLPCCALYETDGQWYRSEIADIVDDNSVQVKYVDYGNDEIVPLTMVKRIEGELLNALPPQAIECCLNGYQNMDVDQERDNLFEELILEQQFTMKVVEMTGKKALVELIDEANCNVASHLLDKIAQAHAIASPVVVPEPVINETPPPNNNRMGNRNNDGGFDRNDRRPNRDNNRNFNQNRSDEKSWRQENNSELRQERYSKESSADTNWRQNDNRGSRGNNDRGSDGRKDINDRLRRDTNRNSTDEWNSGSAPKDTTDDWEGGNDAFSSQNVSGEAASSSNKVWHETRTSSDTGFKKPRSDKFGGGRNKRFDRDNKENWQSRDGNRKKSDFRKDGSEISSSGSEKSFRKGPRTSSRNDHRDKNRPDRFGGGNRGGNRDRDGGGRFRNSFSSTPNTTEESWNVSAVSATPIVATGADEQYGTVEVVGTEAAVMISWFHNPTHFYCQQAQSQIEFKAMMEEIQLFYKDRKPESMFTKGAPVIGQFHEDNVLYRARILDILGGGEVKVIYVDFGNISKVTKMWPVDRKFMSLPAQAIQCGLDGVQAPSEGDVWPAAQKYGTYFEKESYMARFLYNYEDRVYMQLYDGDIDISHQLINDGLASPLASQPHGLSEIEFALLLSQQFPVVLKSVNNLSDIIVALECGLAVNCKAHNLDTATDLYEDNLKSYVEQSVIIYVDNVLENNVLDVTFYDTDGNKIPILSPDEGAYDNVESLCPFLVARSILTGFVSHVDGQTVYIQPTEYTDTILMFLEKLFEFYDAQVQDQPLLPEEGLLYAANSSDDNWYRARVISFVDESATVQYLDYGNTESVPFTKLRELTKEFYTPSVMALPVKVAVPPEELLENEVQATIYYGEDGWEGTVEVQGHTGEQLLSTIPETLAEVGQQAETEVALVPEEGAVATVTASEIMQGTAVFISHVDTPNEFYIQRIEAANALDELQANLQLMAESLPDLENKSVGALCAAPYSVDHLWYRAEILDADEDITTLRFIDYGNTDVVNNATTAVKTLPSTMLTLAVYATRCSLKAKVVDESEEWSQAALDLFQELVGLDDGIFAEFLSQDEKTNYVELYANGKNVKEALIESNLAKPCEIETETKSTGYVSHFNSPSEFWIQFDSCVDELEWIAEQLANVTSFPELEDFSPGTLCAALFTDDELWYRARILSNTAGGVELLFIDYGNSCVSSSLRQLPEDLVVTAPLAQKCALRTPEGVELWSEEACAKFQEISADGQTIFTVKKLSTGETSTVDLILENGQSVVDSLMPTMVNGLIKNVESLDKFSVEVDGNLLEEPYKLEELPDTKWDEASNEKFKQIIAVNEDNIPQEIQIEFIDDKTVRLFINNTDIRTHLGGMKTIHTDAITDTLENTNECCQDESTGDSQFSEPTKQPDSNTDCGEGSNEVVSDSLLESSDNHNSDEMKYVKEEIESQLISDSLEPAHLVKEIVSKALDLGDKLQLPQIQNDIDLITTESPDDDETIHHNVAESKKDLGKDNFTQNEVEFNITNNDVVTSECNEIAKEDEQITSINNVKNDENYDDTLTKSQIDVSIVNETSKVADGLPQNEVEIVESRVENTLISDNVIENSDNTTDVHNASDTKHTTVSDELPEDKPDLVIAESKVEETSEKNDHIAEPAEDRRKDSVLSENSGETRQNIVDFSDSEVKIHDSEVNSNSSHVKSSCVIEDETEDGKTRPSSALGVTENERVDRTSRPSSALSVTENERMLQTSRPASAGSGRINFDEKIVPAALSRPQSPLPLSDEGEQQADQTITPQ